MKAVCIAMLFPHFERLRFDRSAINQSCASFATLMLTGLRCQHFADTLLARYAGASGSWKNWSAQFAVARCEDKT
eukprot:symbB.v1.2.031142.t1/scaffold3583.1/size55484/1